MTVKEHNDPLYRGCTAILAEGIKIQELQSVFLFCPRSGDSHYPSRVDIAAEARQIRRHSTPATKLHLANRRNTIQDRIIKYKHSVKRLFEADESESGNSTLMNDITDAIGDSWRDFLDTTYDNLDDDEDAGMFLLPEDESEDPEMSLTPEQIPIFLPSTIGIRADSGDLFSRLGEKELQLRVGQMDEALSELRLALAQKAFVFREGVRKQTSQKKKLRSFKSVRAVDDTVLMYSRLYVSAYASFLKLGPKTPDRERYQALEKEQVKVSTKSIDPYARGMRHAVLPWFWKMDMEKDIISEDWMEECKSSFSQPQMC